VGGAVWMLEADGQLRLQYHVNLPKEELIDDRRRLEQHQALLRKTVAAGQPTLVPPRAGTTEPDQAGNPTEHLLVLGIVQLDQQTKGLVEIFQRAGGGPTTQRGYLRFLNQMCQSAGDFLKNSRLRQFTEQNALFQSLDDFVRAAYRSLDPTETAFVLANEGRRLIECDRVSVALRRGRRYMVHAVSGMDRIDPRARSVRLLGQLTETVLRAGDPLWYTGDASDQPPEIEHALHEYLDDSHARVVAVLPLRAPVDEDEPPPAPVGALLIEQIRHGALTDANRRRAEAVGEHGGAALAKAVEHDSLFLLPLWRALGRAKWIVQARTLPKTVLVVAAVLGLLAALIFVPADFTLQGDGTLQPQQRREIFAGIDGVVTDVFADHGQSVQHGQVLAQLRNTDLDEAIVQLLGQQTATQEQILSIQRDLLADRRLARDQQDRLAGQLMQLKATAANLQQQLTLYREKERQLVVRSPLTGEVVTWQVHDRLLQRPVQTGQTLMTVVDPSGPWELVVDMPERRMGHVGRAQHADGQPLRVTFLLASHPEQPLVGEVTHLERVAASSEDGAHTVRLRVAVDKAKLPQLRSGLTATAKVHCGRRPIGYVWFHDLLEFAQAKVLFWL